MDKIRKNIIHFYNEGSKLHAEERPSHLARDQLNSYFNECQMC